MICGILGIVFINMANSSFKFGDYFRYESYIRYIKIVLIIGLILGIISCISMSFLTSAFMSSL